MVITCCVVYLIVLVHHVEFCRHSQKMLRMVYLKLLLIKNTNMKPEIKSTGQHDCMANRSGQNVLQTEEILHQYITKQESQSHDYY